MPFSTFAHEIQVSANRDQCWQTITDVNQVASWISIVGDVHENEHLKSYNAVLEDRLGPFRLHADLDIKVSDVVEGHQLHAHAEGEDRQVRSQIMIDGDLRLEAEDGAIKIIIDGSYEVTGRVATLGSSTINSKAQKTINEFLENLSRELA